MHFGGSTLPYAAPQQDWQARGKECLAPAQAIRHRAARGAPEERAHQE